MNHGLCPKCRTPLEADEVDVGVGTVSGPVGCPACHWVPEPSAFGPNPYSIVSGAEFAVVEPAAVTPGPTHTDQRTPAEHVEGFMRSATSPAQRAVADEIRSLRAKLAEAERERDALVADFSRELDDGLKQVKVCTKHPMREVERERDAAIAACAEMRAALEHWTHIYSKALSPPGHDTYGEGMRDAKDQVRAILARTDLGAGMVLVERESIDEWRDLITDLVFDLDAHSRARKAVADLDALLKKGGG